LLIFILTLISSRDQTQVNPVPKSSALLADRNTRYVEGVRGLLETAFDTVYTVADAGSLVEGADRLQPTLIVADLAIAEGDFAGLIRQLRKSSPASKVIALTVHDEPAAVRDLMVAIDKALKEDSLEKPDSRL
jgi:DNA-binding NarL/FixJ family response regulator